MSAMAKWGFSLETRDRRHMEYSRGGSYSWGRRCGDWQREIAIADYHAILPHKAFSLKSEGVNMYYSSICTALTPRRQKPIAKYAVLYENSILSPRVVHSSVAEKLPPVAIIARRLWHIEKTPQSFTAYIPYCIQYRLYNHDGGGRFFQEYDGMEPRPPTVQSVGCVMR